MSTEYVEEELVGDLVLAAECVIMYILINALYTANAEESRWVCTSLDHNKLQMSQILKAATNTCS